MNKAQRAELITNIAENTLECGGILSTSIITRSGIRRHVSVGAHITATEGEYGYDVLVTGPEPTHDLTTMSAQAAARRFVWIVGPLLASQLYQEACWWAESEAEYRDIGV